MSRSHGCLRTIKYLDGDPYLGLIGSWVSTVSLNVTGKKTISQLFICFCTETILAESFKDRKKLNSGSKAMEKFGFKRN